MEGQLIRLDQLPSKGVLYPDDIELYIKPLTIKEQIDMERYGISQAEYYTLALQGVTVRGEFDRNKLLFHDLQFMDLVRMLYTFEPDKEIIVTDYPCSNCGNKIKTSFRLDEISFTDFKEEIFGEDNRGMIYEFSDGLKMRLLPFTISDFLEGSRQFLSNKKYNAGDIYTMYIALCVQEVEGRVFKDIKAQREFVRSYISKLASYKDRSILKKIEENCTSVVEPLKGYCAECDSEVEVRISPSSRFQQ